MEDEPHLLIVDVGLGQVFFTFLDVDYNVVLKGI